MNTHGNGTKCSRDVDSGSLGIFVDVVFSRSYDFLKLLHIPRLNTVPKELLMKFSNHQV